MAATREPRALAALMQAALALPIVAVEAKAGPLEGASVGMRWQDYREDNSRMKVSEPVLWFKAPVGDNYEISASRVVDLVSGASPIIVSNQFGTPVQTLTGASIVDRRVGSDARLTRRFDNVSLSISRALSGEKDYRSHSGGLEAKVDLNDKNTTLVAGIGYSNDRVGSVTNARLHERRDTREYLLGVTQLLSPTAVVQSNLTFTRGSGFYDDPYKITVSFQPNSPAPILYADQRPDGRNQTAWLSKYRRYFPAAAGALQMDYRYYRDSWGVRAHTVDLGWTQTLTERWKVVPSLRYYSQSKADFYRAVIIAPAPATSSSDQRLASFGALAPSVKVILQLDSGTTLDAGLTLYRQRGNWKLGGDGSHEFAPFNARYVILGVTHTF